MLFEWDSTKAESNYRKHGVTFEAATSVFDDPLRISTQDRFENGQYRYQVIGMIDGYRIVLVAHTVNFGNSEEVIRLISARKATSKERKYYDNGSF